MKKPKAANLQLSDDEAEARATAALRRALTTPYKPQKDLKLGKSRKKKATPKKTPKSP